MKKLFGLFALALLLPAGNAHSAKVALACEGNNCVEQRALACDGSNCVNASVPIALDCDGGNCING